MKMIFGYARYYNKPNEDIEELIRLGVKKDNIFIEKSTKESELSKILNLIQEGDTLIVLINSIRTSKQFCEIIKFSKEKRIRLIIGDFEVNCGEEEISEKTKGILEAINIFEKLEDEILSRRIKNGLWKRRESGNKIGRPAVTFETLPINVKELYNLYESGEISQVQYADMCKVSRPSIIKYINIIKSNKG